MIDTHTHYTHSYYDAILGIIPAAFVLGLGATALLGMTLLTGVLLSSGIAAAAIFHALMVRPPIAPRSDTMTTASAPAAVQSPPDGSSPDELA